MSNSLEQYLQRLSLEQYIDLFGCLWNREEKRYVKFAPWPEQRKMLRQIDEWHKDGYWETIHPKARQGGFSEIYAERGLKFSLQNPNTEGLILSKTENDAKYFLEYRIKRKIENLPKIPGLVWPKIVRSTKSEIEFDNGSIITSLPASDTAGSSRTVDWVIMDECGGMDLNNNAHFKEIYNRIVPVIEKAGAQRWLAQIGTSEPGTYYNEKVKGCHEGRNTETKLYFIGWRGDPSRTQSWYDKELMRRGGDLKSMQTQYPETIDEFFVIKEGMVLHMLDKEYGGKHVHDFTISPSWELRTCYDHGYTHPAVDTESYYDPYTDHLYIRRGVFFYEQVVDEIAPQIKKARRMLTGTPVKNLADAAIFNKTGITTIAQHFKKLGVPFDKSFKYRGLSERDGSLGLLQGRLNIGRGKRGGITFHSDCQEGIEDSMMWRYNPKTGKPKDAHDDFADTVRYICADIRPKMREQEKTVVESGYAKKDTQLFDQHGNFNSNSGNTPNSWQAC